MYVCCNSTYFQSLLYAITGKKFIKRNVDTCNSELILPLLVKGCQQFPCIGAVMYLVMTVAAERLYSPDLNPIEQVWHITRREKTHNRYFSRLDKLIDTLDEYFETFRKPNEQFKKLCSFRWLSAS